MCHENPVDAHIFATFWVFLRFVEWIMYEYVWRQPRIAENQASVHAETHIQRFHRTHIQNKVKLYVIVSGRITHSFV